MARRLALFVLIALLLAGALASYAEPVTPAAAEKKTISLDIFCKSATAVELSFGWEAGAGGEAVAYTIQNDEGWRMHWEGLPQLTREGLFIAQLNESVRGFVCAVLGLREEALVRISRTRLTRYAAGLEARLTIELVRGAKIKPLFFLREWRPEDVKEVANIALTITTAPGVALATEDINLLQLRVPLGHYFRSSEITHELVLEDNPWFTPWGMFLALLIYPCCCIALCSYSRKYMRVVKLGNEFWVPALVFYLLPMIPFDEPLFYIFIVAGIVMSGIRAGRALKPVRLHAKKVTVPSGVVEKYVK